MVPCNKELLDPSVDGTLDFYWLVMNDPYSAASIGSFRIGDFVSPEYNANWRSDGSGYLAPDNAYRFTSAFDSYVNFNWSNGLGADDDSRFFFLDTTATNYAKTAIFDLTNMGQTHISGLFAAYSPVAAVPEPETYAMLLAGLGFVGFMARRRKHNHAA